MRKFKNVWMPAFAGMTILSAVSFASELPPGAVPAPMTTYAFDRDPVGGVPNVWSSVVDGPSSGGQWDIKVLQDAPSPTHVLSRKGSGEGSASTALLILNGSTRDHGEIALRFKTLSTDDAQTVGIVFNFIDPQNYWLATASSRDDACSLIRVKKGKSKVIDFKENIITPYKWHELRLVFTTRSYTLLLNKELLLGDKLKNEAPGQVGLFAASNTTAVIDDVQISQ